MCDEAKLTRVFGTHREQKLCLHELVEVVQARDCMYECSSFVSGHIKGQRRYRQARAPSGAPSQTTTARRDDVSAGFLELVADRSRSAKSPRKYSMILRAVAPCVMSPCSWITSGRGAMGCRSTATMTGFAAEVDASGGPSSLSSAGARAARSRLHVHRVSQDWQWQVCHLAYISFWLRTWDQLPVCAEKVSVAETASHWQLARLTWRSAEVCNPGDALEKAVLFVEMKELQDGAKTASDGTPLSLHKSTKADSAHLVGGSCAVAV